MGEKKLELSHLTDCLQMMEHILKELSNIVTHLQTMQKNEYHLIVEKMDVHSVKLDELNFLLDHIAVKELSGAMNIGNTFGSNVQKKAPLSEQKKKEMVKKLKKIKQQSKQAQGRKKEDIQIVINGKKVSYSTAE